MTRDESSTAEFRALKQQALQQAASSFRAAEDWVVFFRKVLGREGLIVQLFPGERSRQAFEQSDEFREIQRMLAKLREQAVPPKEPTKVITVRIPVSLHESLREEAHRRCTSVNKLCISKLVQIIDDQLIPSDISWRSPSGPGLSGRGDGEPG